MSAPAAAATPVRTTPRWLWTALVVSLALNLLLIGLFAGAAIFRQRWAGGPGWAAAQSFGYLRTLPKERREQLRQANRERISELRPMWQAVRQARQEADAVFMAEPFEAERFVAAQQRMIDAEAAARRSAAQLLASTGAQLSVDERKAMLHWRERHGGRRGQGRGHSGPDGEPGEPPKRP